jgi:hypothetical protein
MTAPLSVTSVTADALPPVGSGPRRVTRHKIKAVLVEPEVL